MAALIVVFVFGIILGTLTAVVLNLFTMEDKIKSMDYKTEMIREDVDKIAIAITDFVGRMKKAKLIKS